MREKKYANVLLEDEDKNKFSQLNDKEEDKEVDGIKLSLTRELKFKELQEEIDKITPEDMKRELNEDFDLVDTKERKIINKKFEKFADNIEGTTIEERDEDKDALLMPKEKGSKRIVGAYAIKKEDDEDKTQDIYLTNSFKPLKARFKISNLFKRLLTIIIILVILGAFGYFLGLPIYKLYINSKPLNVYNNTIDYVRDELNNAVDFIYNKGEYLTIDYKINPTINGSNSYLVGGYQYGISINGDINNNAILKYYVIDNDKEYGLSTIKYNNRLYTNLLGTNIYFNGTEYEELENFISSYGNISREDLHYLVNKYSTIIKNIISEATIKSSKDVIEVRGEEVSVIKNTLVLDSETKKNIGKKYVDLILDDNKFITLLASLKNEDKNVIMDYYSNLLNDIGNDKEVINIYTRKGTKVVGFDMEKDGFRTVYFYKNDAGDFESYINSTDEICIDGKCNIESNIYSFNGIKNSDNTLVRINYNNSELMTLTIYEISKDMINLDYVYNLEKKEITGSFKYKDKIDMSYKKRNNNGTLSMISNTTDTIKVDGEIKEYNSNAFNNYFNEYKNSMDGDAYKALSLYEDTIIGIINDIWFNDEMIRMFK